MNKEETLRFECVRIVCEHSTGRGTDRVITMAAELYEFISGDTATVDTAEPEPSSSFDWAETKSGMAFEDIDGDIVWFIGWIWNTKERVMVITEERDLYYSGGYGKTSELFLRDVEAYMLVRAPNHDVEV